MKLEQRTILLRLGFQTDEGDFVKWIRNEIVMRQDVAPDVDCVEELVQVELKYYPLKIRDLEIPTYIIPIKDVWAGQLFDNVISSEDIFGADPTKLWYYENVYYRSRLPLSEVAPGRILWYVCKRKKMKKEVFFEIYEEGFGYVREKM